MSTSGDDGQSPSQSTGRFPQTRQTKMQKAQIAGPVGAEARAWLWERYAEPVEAEMRWRLRRLAPHVNRDTDAAHGYAADLLIRMFSDGPHGDARVLRYTRERGRFCTFLRAVLYNWLVEQLKHAATERQGGGRIVTALLDWAPDDTPPPDEEAELAEDTAAATFYHARAVRLVWEASSQDDILRRFRWLSRAQEMIASCGRIDRPTLAAELGITGGNLRVKMSDFRDALWDAVLAGLGEEGFYPTHPDYEVELIFALAGWSDRLPARPNDLPPPNVRFAAS